MPQARHNPIKSHLSDKEKEILIDHIDSDDLPSLAIDMDKFGINFVIQGLLPTQKYQMMEWNGCWYIFVADGTQTIVYSFFSKNTLLRTQGNMSILSMPKQSKATHVYTFVLFGWVKNASKSYWTLEVSICMREIQRTWSPLMSPSTIKVRKIWRFYISFKSYKSLF